MLRYRPGPIRQAAILAAGFIVLRVGYRALFHGLDGSGAVLLDLPEVRLPDPFAHVVLFGPITTGGLTAAVLSAVPIALTILAFGVLNAFVDLSRVFARGASRGPLRGISRALVIAWATFPGLADGVRSVRLARRLRGERAAATLLVPVFERTVERAVAVAAAMEVRGFAAGRRVEGACAHPVEVRGAVLSRPDGWTLAIDDLRLVPGTLTVLAGATGSGKSSVLDALSGLFSHVDGGRIAGTVLVGEVDRAAVPPRETAGFVGVVRQDPRSGFASETVHAEIGFALDVRGVAPVIVADRVREIADRVGIAGLLDRDLRALSAGEATLVAIAAAIVERPTLLLVDEPLADLDRDARVRIAALLGALAHEAGVCVVVAEHRVTELDALADVRVEVGDGRVVVVDGRGVAADGRVAVDGRVVADGRVAASPVVPSAWAAGAGIGHPGGPDADRSGATPAPSLQLAGLSVTHRRTGAARGAAAAPAVRSASLIVAAGEIVALAGPNGAGKSSLLVAAALPTDRDTVRVGGADVAGIADRERRRRIALVPEASDDLFVSLTVAEECRRADRAADAPAGATADLLLGFLGLDAAAAGALLTRHPRDLSVGQRRCLALAIQLAADPDVLLVDEPTRGLDPAARAMVAAALVAVARRGGAVVLATHDRAFAEPLADRIVPMHAGRVGEHAPGWADAPSPPHRSPAAPADAALRTSSHPAPPDVARMAHVAAPGEPDLRPRDAMSQTRPGGDGEVRRMGDITVPASGTGGADARPPGIRSARARGGRDRWTGVVLVAGTLVGAAAFAWPLVTPALPAQAQAAAPFAALALAPIALAVLVFALDGSVRSAKALALLGTLAAVGAAVRIAGTGVGGVEAVFVLLVVAGRAFGARFGFLLGVLVILLSSTMQGGFGPWTPFQAFACGWVGAGAGLLPGGRMGGPQVRRTFLAQASGGTRARASNARPTPAAVDAARTPATLRRSRAGEIALLAAYGIVASYAFGLVMNLWFWPFAVGAGAGISYDAGAPLPENLASFLLYSLVTSTASWDTLRAITTVVGLAVAGSAMLAALRRVKLPSGRMPRPDVTPRSTSPRGGGTRTRPSTAPGAAAARR
ncbi:ATP-binding cassette domain-containing protein [Agromyces sp. MMS24-K17]|uniref:ATP-binding cassette domain-containing protein n=1 Tax=Agromyces sp. MMS24-K17 TaxID=3372850 RepID=UPI00375441F6